MYVNCNFNHKCIKKRKNNICWRCFSDIPINIPLATIGAFLNINYLNLEDGYRGKISS